MVSTKQCQTANSASPKNWKPAQNWAVFVLLTLIMLWAAHALAFFAHEYGHSFTAWVLGWKGNPLALNYGRPDVSNWLMQGDIDENVDYGPIFAAGDNIQAGVIAGAGMVLGNALITYPLSLWGYGTARRKGAHAWALLFYWLCLCSVGNFVDYVPVRTFSDHGDMHTLALGFHCSPWCIIIVLGIPFGIALAHFLFRFLPQSLPWLFPASPARRVVMVCLSAFMMFGFYGFVGWGGYGPVAHGISAVSVFGLLPLTVVMGVWWVIKRKPV